MIPCNQLYQQGLCFHVVTIVGIVSANKAKLYVCKSKMCAYRLYYKRISGSTVGNKTEDSERIGNAHISHGQGKKCHQDHTRQHTEREDKDVGRRPDNVCGGEVVEVNPTIWCSGRGDGPSN